MALDYRDMEHGSFEQYNCYEVILGYEERQAVEDSMKNKGCLWLAINTGERVKVFNTWFDCL
jgi:hypothetical protein